MAILSDTPETCQHFFKVFPKFYSRTGSLPGSDLGGKRPPSVAAAKLRCDPASKILRDAAPLAAEAGNPEANYL